MDLSDIWAKWVKLHSAGKLFLGVLFVQTIALTAFNVQPAFDDENPKQQFFSITLMLRYADLSAHNLCYAVLSSLTISALMA